MSFNAGQQAAVRSAFRLAGFAGSLEVMPIASDDAFVLAVLHARLLRQDAREALTPGGDVEPLQDRAQELRGRRPTSRDCSSTAP